MLSRVDKIADHHDGAFLNHAVLQEEEGTQGSPYTWIVPVFTENVRWIKGTRNVMEP